MIYAREIKRDIIKKGELPRLKCFHNGIILIVICFQYQMYLIISTIHNTLYNNCIVKINDKKKFQE
jgi:hypothetical protein